MTSQTLITLRAVSNGALVAEQLPTRLKILDWGRNATVKGTILVDDETAKSFEERQQSAGHGEIAIDFEHNTVAGSPEYERTKEPRPVAGYGRPTILRGDGLYLSNIRWTPDGQASAKNFADLSPAVQVDGENRVTFVHSVALCRNGAVHELTFFSAALGSAEADAEELKNVFTAEELRNAVRAPGANNQTLIGILWSYAQPILTAQREAKYLMAQRAKLDVKHATPEERTAERIKSIDTRLKELATVTAAYSAPSGLSRSIAVARAQYTFNVAALLTAADPWTDNVNLPQTIPDWALALSLPAGTNKNAVLLELWVRSAARAAQAARSPLTLNVKQAILAEALVLLNSGQATERDIACIRALSAEIEGKPATVAASAGPGRFPFLTGMQRAIEAHKSEVAARR